MLTDLRQAGTTLVPTKSITTDHIDLLIHTAEYDPPKVQQWFSTLYGPQDIQRWLDHYLTGYCEQELYVPKSIDDHRLVAISNSIGVLNCYNVKINRIAVSLLVNRSLRYCFNQIVGSGKGRAHSSSNMICGYKLCVETIPETIPQLDTIRVWLDRPWTVRY